MITRRSITLLLLLLFVPASFTLADFTQEQLARWLKRFPQADTNGDGQLTKAEAEAYRRKRLQTPGGREGIQRGAPRQFKVDPGWKSERFPEHAVCYRTADEIAKVYADTLSGRGKPIVSYPKPKDGALRIVGTGHSFMTPGYRTFPSIARAAGIEQPLYTHVGGGMTGSTRYKWEQENGIFQFDGKPKPKLLASIANASWEAMMWGPYFNDRPEYYSCWIDFCLKYNPEMKFFLSDAWPQLYQLEDVPTSESFFTEAVFDRLKKEREATYVKMVGTLREQYGKRVFIMPTCDAMVLAAKHFLRGELPGIEGLHRVVGGKERSLWRDHLGHLGPGFDRLEGYVFYATIYGRSPERIDNEIAFQGEGDFPSPELDAVFRRIAWQAVIGNPLTGVRDRNGNGVDDARD